MSDLSSDKKWIKSHYDVDREFFLLWLDTKLRAYSHGFFESDDESLGRRGECLPTPPSDTKIESAGKGPWTQPR